MNDRIQVIRSNRRSLCIQINGKGDVIVRAPYRLSEREIKRFVEEKSGWIEKQLLKVRARQQDNEGMEKQHQYTVQELESLAKKAAQWIPERVARYAGQMGVSYGRITIRSQRTRWGSCSQKGNLNFNCLLMLAPPDVIDYVVVHELCHRKEMNHSARFWEEVEMVLPNYRESRKWLKDHGTTLILGLQR